MHPPKSAFSALKTMFPVLLMALAACQGETAAPTLPAPERPAFDSVRAWKLLEQQVKLGPRPSGTLENRKTRELILAELTAYGLSPKREPFKAQTPRGEIEMENIFADFEGRPGPRGEPAPMIVLGSHFDTKAFPFEFVGANDGASNTAVLLELARVLSPASTPPVTYRFIFFDGEESVRPDWVDPDNRYGSRHHVKELDKRKGALKRVKAMILLDLVGDSDLQLEYDSSSSRQLVEIFVKTAKRIGDPKLFASTPYPVEDDHEMFIQVGIPSVDLIDLHFGRIANEYWHTAEDTLERCSQDSLRRVGELVLAALPRVTETFVR